MGACKVGRVGLAILDISPQARVLSWNAQCFRHMAMQLTTGPTGLRGVLAVFALATMQRVDTNVGMTAPAASGLGKFRGGWESGARSDATKPGG
jgi:hypothetical protein